jgi:hypothetical protein
MKLIAALALVALAAGCTNLTPAQEAQSDMFECRVAAFRPLVEPAFDAADVARDALAGKVDPRLIAAKLGATVEAINAAVSAWNACAPEAAPEVAPVQLTAS